MRFVDLTGQKFGRLSVIERAPNKKDRVAWLCKCDCGNEIVTTSRLLQTGQTTSCGCFHRERTKLTHTKHGGRYDKLYAVWIVMRDRCYNLKNKDYADYGGRGIIVCEEWRNSENGFQNFREWAKNNGYRESLSIERMDVNKNYEPCNCKWATQKEQCNNKRNNRIITFNGKKQTLSQWAEEVGIPRSVLLSRIDRYHWDIEKALTSPVKKTKRNINKL